MELVIIAGGKGTRLGLEDIPKPMVTLCEKPLLEHQILLAKRYGITSIHMLLGYKADVIMDYFGDGSQRGVNIQYYVEEIPLGTAGALKELEGVVKDRFLVFYGDVMMDFDLQRFIDFDSAEPSSGTLVVHPNDHPQDSDLLEVEELSGKVLQVFPKPHGSLEKLANIVNAAVYIFSPAIFSFIEAGVSADIGRDILPTFVVNKQVRAYATTEFIKDIGTPKRYKQIEKDYQSGKIQSRNLENRQKAIFIDRDGVINKEIDGVTVVDDLELLDGVSEAIRTINKSGYLAVCITNQPVIAKGFCSEETVRDIHNSLQMKLGMNGAFLDAVYMCPHHPERGFEGEVTALKIECECRKPKPGMFLRAAGELNIDLTRSHMVGDRHVDMIAAQRAAIPGRFLLSDDVLPDVKSCESLLDAVNQIVGSKA